MNITMIDLPSVFAALSDYGTPAAIALGGACVGWLIRDAMARRARVDAPPAAAAPRAETKIEKAEPSLREGELIQEVKTLRAELELLRARLRGPGPDLSTGPNLSKGPSLG